MKPKISALLPFLLLFLLAACSLQKRHYTKGFYVEKNTSTQSTAIVKRSFPEKMRISSQTFSHQTDPVSLNEPLAVVPVKTEMLKHETVSVSKKPIHAITAKPQNNIPKRTCIEEEPDTNLNHTAKASARLAIYSLLFFAGAMYVFFMLPGNFYIVLSLLIITFIFSLVTFLTSVHARKDTIATNRKGRNISRFATVLSLMLLAAIALFFIFTPISI